MIFLLDFWSIVFAGGRRVNERRDRITHSEGQETFNLSDPVNGTHLTSAENAVIVSVSRVIILSGI